MRNATEMSKISFILRLNLYCTFKFLNMFEIFYDKLENLITCLKKRFNYQKLSKIIVNFK